jgi:hypothetical protein
MVAWWERFQRLSASPSALYAQEQVFRELDIRRLLPAISVPTLVLHRAQDLIEPVGAGRYLASEIASAEYVELSGADHFPWAGDQDSLIAEVERFVGTVHSDEQETFDRVLATILFTDIVDSTAQAAAMGDHRWRHVREQHAHVTRAQLARFRGRRELGRRVPCCLRRTRPRRALRSSDLRVDEPARAPAPGRASHRRG